MKRLMISLFCALCLFPKLTNADTESNLEAQVRELSQMVRELKSTVDAQQKEIASLKNSRLPNSTSQPSSSQAVSSPAPKIMGKFIPEIGVIADVALKLDTPRSDDGGVDRLSVREVELVLGSHVDPYSRFDATIAFTEESMELEEAYLTRFELPWDITARIGRLKPRIGKILPTHRDSLDTVDEPLVIQRYFGAEGMSKTGVDFKKLLELPTPFTHELTMGILEGGNGEGGAAFGQTKRRPTLYSHLKNYVDLSDVTNLELGFSHAMGSRDADSTFEVHLLGLDGTLIHALNANQTMKLQGELYHMSRTESEFELTDETTNVITLQDLDGNIFGGFLLFDFRFHSRWAAGFRYDNVEIVDRSVSSLDHRDIGYTGYLTFYQSEFARWRAQASHFELTNGTDDNQFLIQGTFAIGEHKHKIQ